MGCFLYRFFDDERKLLYVGVSANPALRAKQHKRDSTWFAGVLDMTAEFFDNRDAALLAERRAIQEEHPAYNVFHQRWFDTPEGRYTGSK